jgi:hypothetical protein
VECQIWIRADADDGSMTNTGDARPSGLGGKRLNFFLDLAARLASRDFCLPQSTVE